jgi:hypothetical protein
VGAGGSVGTGIAVGRFADLLDLSAFADLSDLPDLFLMLLIDGVFADLADFPDLLVSILGDLVVGADGADGVFVDLLELRLLLLRCRLAGLKKGF